MIRNPLLSHFLFAVLAGSPLFGANYRQIDVPGSVSTNILGINSQADVVGQYQKTVDGTHFGFLLSKGKFTDIIYPGSVLDQATGINDSGDIVGFYTDTGSNDHGFLEHEGSFTSIDFPNASTTQANGINNAGDIVGGYVDQASMWHGFVLHDGVFQSIDPPSSDFSEAYGINDQGVISGYASYYDGTGDIDSGYVLAQGQLKTFYVDNNVYTCVQGINNKNELVGFFDVPTLPNQGFALSRTQYVPLNFPASIDTRPRAINSNDVVVGWFISAAGTMHGFVATR